MSIITTGDSRIKRIEVSDEQGNHIGEIVFNPYDLSSLEKFWAIYDRQYRGSQKLKELEIELGQMDTGILEQELNSDEDFEKAGKVIDGSLKVMQVAFDTFDDVVKGLDEILGEGTCQMFLKGYRDDGMLAPLIEGVLPFFEEAQAERRKKVEEAKLNRAERRSLNR